MRSSKPLRGLSLSGFALWGYLQKLCFVSKLSSAVLESRPRGGRHAQLDSATASSRCRASPYGNIYQKTASQASLHAVESESRPRGGRHAQLEAAARPLAVGLRPMGIFTKKLLCKQACTQLFGKYSRMTQLSHIFLKIPLHFRETPGIILLAVT